MRVRCSFVLPRWPSGEGESHQGSSPSARGDGHPRGPLRVGGGRLRPRFGVFTHGTAPNAQLEHKAVAVSVPPLDPLQGARQATA